MFPNPLPALPTRRPDAGLLAAAAVVLVVLPLIFVAGHDAAEHGGGGLVPVPGRLRPGAVDFGLRAARRPGTQRLTWNAPYSGTTEGLLHDAPLAAGRARPRPNGDRKAIEGLACRDARTAPR